MTRIVLLHGGGTDGRCWDALRDHMPGHDLRSPDLPGHGDEPAAAGDTVEAVAEALRPRIEALTRPGWVLVGHSFGGMVAMVLATGAGPPPARLVLADTFDRPARDVRSRSRILGMQLGAWMLGHRRVTEMVIAREGIGADGHDAALRASMTHRPAMGLHRMLAAVRRFDGRPYLDRLSMPVLALMAGGNPATDGTGERIARRVADGRVAVMPGVGHMQMRDDPAGFARHLREFVEDGDAG